MNNSKKSTFGLDKNIVMGIIYLGGIIGGLIFFFSEQDDKEVRFHGLQSIIIGIVLGIVLIISPIVFAIISFSLHYIGVSFFVITALSIFLVLILFSFTFSIVILGILGFAGKTYRIPIIGNIADKFMK